MPRVLITGGSGLLGRAVCQEFGAHPDWTFLGLAFSRISGGLKKVDLTNENNVKDVIQEFRPDIVVHCAAERKPDVVENNQEATQALNVAATEMLCKHAGSVNASVMYMSTDYVFDGENPPYQVDSKPNPLNKYGMSKLAGEKVAMAVSKENLVLRVPILYGEVENLDESAVTVLFKNLKDTSKPCSMDDYQIRFPTLVDDVAVVIRQLAEKKLQDKSISGIFHWSGKEQMTKYSIAKIMAEVCQLEANHMTANKNPPMGGAKRPQNAQLDTARLEALGIGNSTPFREAISRCLKPFI